MENLAKAIILIAAMATVGIAQTRAQYIDGNVGITGGVSFDSNSAGTATAVTSWASTFVIFPSGSFTNLPYHTPVVFSPKNWYYNTTNTVTNFWSAGGFSFDLLYSINSMQGGTIFGGNNGNGFVVSYGVGVIRGNGFVPTAASWSFTSQDPIAAQNPDLWSFVAFVNTAVLRYNLSSNSITFYGIPQFFALQAGPTPNGLFTNVAETTFYFGDDMTNQPRFFRLKAIMP